jgi:hypothetical protein
MSQGHHRQYQFHIPSHHPQGIDGDVLVYRGYAEAICEMLSNTTGENVGITIGIFGDWGMGKSSILRMVEEMLRGSKSEMTTVENTKNISTGRQSDEYKPLPVTFNAWQYAHEEELWLAFLRRILDEIEINVGSRRLAKLNWALWKNRAMTGPVFWLGLWRLLAKGILIGFVVGVFISVLNALQQLKFLQTWGASALVACIALISSYVWKFISTILNDEISIAIPSLTLPGFDRSQVIQIDTFRTDLNSVLGEFANERPLVVLIDDLDRCAPDQIISILEAIKHFDISSISNHKISRKHGFAPIAFVLAADRHSIERAVRAHYKNYLEGMREDRRRTFAREYIEKIIQIPFELPPLTSKKLGEFLDTRSGLKFGS